MMSPGVDVIVPCYNYAGFLPACAASVLQEQGVPVRLLIIDDASSDGSAAVAHGIAAGDAQVEARVHATNHGHIATYNEGLRWARADYLLLLSADDVLAPGALRRAVELMIARPEVAFVYGPAVRFSGPEPEWEGGQATSAPDVTPGADFLRGICRRPVNPVETATAVVRTAIQKRVGGYRAEFPHAGDLEMWLRLATHGDVGRVGDIQAGVRLHGRNMHQAYAGAEDLRQRLQVLLSVLDTCAARISGARGLRKMALRNLAADAVAGAENAFDRGRSYASHLRLAREIRPAIVASPRYARLAAKRLLRRAGFQQPQGGIVAHVRPAKASATPKSP